MVLKQDRKGIEKRFFDLCSEVVEKEGLYLYDLDYFPGSGELRVFIQNPETGSAVLDDCSRVDRALTPFIDEEEWMPESLTLEVSSPGMFRQLCTIGHFEMVTGEQIQLTIKSKLTEESYPGLPKKLTREKKFVGMLIEADESGVMIEACDYQLKLKYEDIKKANLEPMLN